LSFNSHYIPLWYRNKTFKIEEKTKEIELTKAIGKIKVVY